MTSCHVFAELFGRPQNYKELYNLRHSQARNVIERIFGVAKKYFVILWETNEYPMLTQVKKVSECGVIHNFIGTYDPDDQPEPWGSGGSQGSEGGSPPSSQVPELPGTGNIGAHETQRASGKREDIAQAMWLSYQGIAGQRTGLTSLQGICM